MRPSHHCHGSALAYAVFTLTVLAVISGTVLRGVSDEYLNTFHAASWQEALLAAESGVDLATLQLRQNLTVPGGTWPSPWSASGTTGQSMSASFTHVGEGGASMVVNVTVECPVQLIDPISGWQYYRVRSTGTKVLSSSHRAGMDRRELDLRKLSLFKDRVSGQVLTQPQVSRTVEVIARPASAFPLALLSRQSTSMTDQNIVVDSYDSSDPNKSTNGQWDLTKRQSHGDVATDGSLISAGNSHIYGNVSTNGGTVTGISNIAGQIRNDFYQDLPDISAPTWSAYTPVTVGGGSTLTAAAVKGTARYKAPTISLSGNNTLSILGPAGGGTSYIEIWLTGDLSTKGNAQITIDKNVIATFYVGGDMTVAGNGIQNGNGVASDRPANVLIYGLKPPAGTSQSFNFNGNADIEAGIYAPDADVTIVGGGSNGSYSGSIVGNNISMTGITQVHYDEALKSRGIVSGYRIASWFEDTR